MGEDFFKAERTMALNIICITNNKYITNNRYIRNTIMLNTFKNYTLTMPKKGVGVTLDIDVLKAIKEIQNSVRGAKFSPLVNDLLREHPEIKKRLKENGKQTKA